MSTRAATGGWSPATRAGALPAGGLVELLEMNKAQQAVDLAGGVPGRPVTPPGLVEAACEVFGAGNHQYASPDGDLGLREQIAESLKGYADPATEITVTVGASEAICVSLLATVDPGDEVVVLEPFYENFLSAIAVAGGRPRFVRLRSPDWSWDPDELRAVFGPRTKAIILNSPSNPTGRILTREELVEIGELCARWNVTVISDETYSAYAYDGRSHISVADLAGLADRAISIGSFSKSHAISGWRIGHVRAPQPITRVLRSVRSATSCGAPGPLQAAISKALPFITGNHDPATEMQERRDRVVESFAGFGLKCEPPQGGCYLFADISSVSSDGCEAFARDLLTDRNVLVAPGKFFYRGQNGNSGHVRIAFNKSPETLREAGKMLSGFSS